MSLANAAPIAFIPTADAESARRFYEHTLGLTFVSDDGFALVFRVGPAPGTMLRLVRVGNFAPVPFTIFGWESPTLDHTVDHLIAQGVSPLRFDGLEQDSRGIWKAPAGAAVAWFKDPDGNTLSVSQHNL